MVLRLSVGWRIFLLRISHANVYSKVTQIFVLFHHSHNSIAIAATSIASRRILPFASVPRIYCFPFACLAHEWMGDAPILLDYPIRNRFGAIKNAHKQKMPFADNESIFLRPLFIWFLHLRVLWFYAIHDERASAREREQRRRLPLIVAAAAAVANLEYKFIRCLFQHGICMLDAKAATGDRPNGFLIRAAMRVEAYGSCEWCLWSCATAIELWAMHVRHANQRRWRLLIKLALSMFVIVIVLVRNELFTP